MSLRRWALGAAMAVSVLVAAPMAAPLGTPTAHAQEESILRVALAQDIDTLNPFQAVFLSSTQIGRSMYEFLTAASAEDSQPEPGLAESWEVAEDNLTWTFTIRDGMEWSDGEPITAHDVAFTYNLIMTNEDAAAANGPAVANYETVEATDDTTLVIRTKQPQASMLTSEIPIVPEHVWKDVEDIAGFTNTETLPAVGSGPFVLTGYEESQTVTLEANDKFWRGRPKVDKLQFVKYENSEAAVQGLIKGDVDLVFNLQPLQFDTLANEENITTHAGRYRRHLEIVLNPMNPKPTGERFGNGHPALADLNVRKALHHAIDVDTLIEEVFDGNADPATQVIPSVFPDWQFKPEEGQVRQFDLDEANRLLDQAGLQRGGDGKRVDASGEPIELRLLGRSEETVQQEIASYIEEWYAELGITIRPEFKASNQVSDDYDAGNYDLGFTGWSVGPDPDFTLAQQTCEYVGHPLADSSFCNADYDRLYPQQLSELDKEKRQEIVQEMQSILYDNVSAIVLVYPTQLEAYRSDRFGEFPLQPADGGVINNQTGYWAYFGAEPLDAASAEESSGLGTGAVVGIVAGAAVLVAGGVWGVSRRRRSADDRE